MTNEERIEKITEALDLIAEAQDLVDEAVNGTGIKGNYNAYGKYGFNQLQGNGNPYDSSLDSLIEYFEKEEEEEDK